MAKEPSSILTLMYDFLLYLVPQLSKFPRDQKFLLADRMQTLVRSRAFRRLLLMD